MTEGSPMAAEMKPESARSDLDFSRPAEDTLLMRLSGDWTIRQDLPSPDQVQRELDTEPQVRRIGFDTERLTHWDSGLLTFLVKMRDLCSQRSIQLESDGLPEGVQRLLALASAVPEKKDARAKTMREPFFSQVGANTIDFVRSTGYGLYEVLGG
jgi:phospholipid/cholesterol/gamma-HCH transport system permease protein